MKFNTWIKQGISNYYLNKDFKFNPELTDSAGFREWFKAMKSIDDVSVSKLFDVNTIHDYKKDFYWILIYLLFWMIVPLIIIHTGDFKNHLFTAFLAGISGSATASIQSLLNRYSNGLEDAYGNHFPYTDKKTEKFNFRMLPWYYLRPWLGATIGVLLYAAMNSGYLMVRSISHDSVLFWGFLGGLLAKSIIQILKNFLGTIIKV